MKKQNVYQDHMLSLLAEIILDQSFREFSISKLYEQIDEALVEGDQKRFLSLTQELNTILKG